ncbi:MAG: Mut7-C RNAse domain-containing protein [Spirochaetota bacterium]
MATVALRFYEELNDFLPPERRKTAFSVAIDGTPSVKDVIERCGVPHPEVDLVLVDGRSVGWDERLSGGERVAVYPVFESIDIGEAQRLRPEPLREPRFAVDASLGALATLLRLLGFSATYEKDQADAALVALASREQRILLTRDREILKRSLVSRGYYVRSSVPEEQAAEVVARFDLAAIARPFSRCTACGGALRPATSDEVEANVPPRSREAYDEFFVCARCGKAFWRGSHWEELRSKIERIFTAVHSLW